MNRSNRPHRGTFVVFYQLPGISYRLSVISGYCLLLRADADPAARTSLCVYVCVCGWQVMGQEKRTLSGFSSKATVSHAGLMFLSDVVQLAPPYLRTKALRVTAAKVRTYLYCREAERGV